MKKEDKVSKKVVILIMVISILFLLIIFFAFLCFNLQKEKTTVYDSGSILMTYSNKNNSLTIDNALPLSDSDGTKLNNVNYYFDFTVNTNLRDSKKMIYEITINKDSSSDISDDSIRVYLEKQQSGTYSKVFGPQKYIPLTKKTDVGSPVGSMVLLRSVVKDDSSDNYRLKMWVSSDEALDNSVAGNYTVKVDVYGKVQ